MAGYDFSRFFFYRWRYVIGYLSLALLLAGTLIFAGLFVPGGISQDEKTSVVISQQLDPSDTATLAVTNLPYHIFQDIILNIFGISDFTIKLPSLILALVSALGMIELLKRWFKPNISILASLIAITTGPYLFTAQLGTPDILYIFWPIMILLLGTQVTRQQNHRLLWKVLFGLAVAFSLYTPYNIYIVIATALTVILHPHLRAVIRKLSRKRLAITTGATFIALLPLIILSVKNPHLIRELVGIPLETPNIRENLTLLMEQYFFFWEPSTTTIMTPVFGLGTVLIIILGLSRLLRTTNTTRSYLIILWLVCLSPMLIVNPLLTTLTFIPAVMLIAAGLTSLISYWYRLFPKNPYARIAGLIPIVILIASLIGSGVTRYVYGYYYSPSAANLFSKDIQLLPDTTSQLLISGDDKQFYQAVSEYRDSFEVVDQPSANSVVVARGDTDKMDGYHVVKIITSASSSDSDRFYIYQKD